MAEIMGSMPESKSGNPTTEVKTEVDISNPAAKKDSETPAPPKLVSRIEYLSIG